MSSSALESSGSKKRAAVSPLKTDEESIASNANQHKLRRLADEDGADGGEGYSDQKPSANPHRDLDAAFQRKSQALADIEAAQQRLKDSLVDIEKARQDIRSRGEAEFDSLLIVGNDSISHLLTFFGVKGLCRLEMVCKAFKRQSSEAWKVLDKVMGQHNRSMSDCPKTRCVRHRRGSDYAQKMEELAGSHRFVQKSRYHEDPDEWDAFRISTLDYCDKFKEYAFGHHWSNGAVTCDFPDYMAMVDSSDKELFVQIRAEGVVLLQGILPLRRLKFSFDLDLSRAKCPRWTEMEKLLSLRREGKESTKNKTMWDTTVEAVLTTLRYSAIITLVSFSKGHEPHLVAAIDDFQDDDDFEEDQDWVTKVLGIMPRKPHNEAEGALVAVREVAFGWYRTKDVIGFCLSDSDFFL